MALSADWDTKVITVPKADLTLLQASPEIRELNVNTFRQWIRALEASEEGMPHIGQISTVAPVTVAGVTLARIVEIVNGYTVLFENGTYSINVVGGNSNIADVKVFNSVSVNTANSAGLIQIESAEDQIAIADAVWNKTVPGSYPAGSAGARLNVNVSTRSVPGDQMGLTSGGTSAILDSLLSGHIQSGSLGEALTLIRGMIQSNYIIDNTTYSASGMLIGWRVRIFPDASSASGATQGGTGEGEIMTFGGTATEDVNNKMTLFRVVRA